MWRWLLGRFERRRAAERARREAMWRELGGRPASLRLPIQAPPDDSPDFRVWSSSEIELEKKNRSRSC